MIERPKRALRALVGHGRRLIPWVRWNTPILALVGIVVVVLVVVTASSSSEVARACTQSPVGCGVGENAIVVVLVGLIAYVALIGRSRSGALRAYRRTMRTGAPIAADGTAIRGTDAELRVVEAALGDLANGGSANPIVVVGESGVGKSTALALLKVRCAYRGLIAIDVDLGRASETDLLRLAYERFASTLAPYVRGAEQVDALWHYLLQASKLVCLVDGVDDLSAGFEPRLREHVVATGARRAAEAGLKVVLAARSFGQEPEAARFVRLWLPPLEEDAWCALLAGMGVDQRLVEGRLDAVQSELRTPFVANLVRALPGDRIDFPEGKTQVPASQVWLIGAYLEEVLRAESRAPALRSEALAAVAELAAIASLEGRSSLRIEPSGSQRVETLSRALAQRDGVDLALRAGVLEYAGDRETFRFAHGLFEDFLASRGARQDATIRELLVRRSVITHRYRLLAMAAFDDAGRVDPSFLSLAEPLVRTTLLEAGIEGSLALVTIWLGYRRAQDATGRWWQVARVAARLQARATESERRAFVSELAHDESPEASWLLWRYAHDPVFAIRWAAAVHLASRGASALELLAGRFERILVTTEEAVERSAVPTHYLSSGVVAWLLPSLVALAAPAQQQAASSLLQRMTALAKAASDPLWLEQSLARGYKMAAFCEHGAPEHRAGSVEMLTSQPRFWYSRINLVQAIARDGGGEATIALLQGLMQRDPHPFVREAARQAKEVARGTTTHRTWLWLVEAELVEHGFERLDPEALLLLADVVLLLNLLFCKLNDSAIERTKSALARQWATDAGLPRCVEDAYHRRALFGGCRGRCRFELCPYPLDASRGTARGEFTPSFCRAVARALEQGGVERPWVRGSSAQLRSFWRDMEAASRLPVGGELR